MMFAAEASSLAKAMGTWDDTNGDDIGPTEYIRDRHKNTSKSLAGCLSLESCH